MPEQTPMMKQYHRLKKESGDAVLFFRLGDFYEMFEKDAKDVSAILNITLTKRNGIDMCGIPYHAAQSYIARLLKAGKKIAVCEQISLPEGGKGIAERAIVEVITPGTIVDEDILSGKENNYLAAIGIQKHECSLSYIDCSTGEFYATSFHEDVLFERIKEEFEKNKPAELLIQDTILEDHPNIGTFLRDNKKLLINRYPVWCFDMQESYSRLCDLFHVLNLKGFGIEKDNPAIYSTGVLLDYLKDTNKSTLFHVTSLKMYLDTQYVGMDESTIRNLEIFSNMHDGSENYTLIDILDFTKTSMGGRLLKSWLGKPLINAVQINERLNRIEDIYHDQFMLNNLRDILGGILDTGRLISRVALEKAHAKDLLGLGGSLEKALQIIKHISGWEKCSDFKLPGEKAISDIRMVCSKIGSAIAEDPSVLLTEGKLIKTGYSNVLDQLRTLKNSSQEVLDDYLEKEKTSTGISNLKIKYNKIIGHFLEVTKSQAALVPEHFIRRQSLVGSERFTSERLSELESEINNASEKIIGLEKELFLKVRSEIAQYIRGMLEFTSFIAEADCICSFAVTATSYGYTRPQVNLSSKISIIEGRHPVVEAHLPPGEFVPNSIDLIADKQNFIMLTGPNMAGKSTFLRQTALITLMAQIGSFVPAKDAEIGVVDKIFCRVGASDNLSRGESTFLVEMNETSHILRTATEKSLIIMDEVGRGTSTKDGLSIAWAVSEYILNMLKSKTLFATHFHELTEIKHPSLRPMFMTIVKDKGEIIFLKKVKDGVNANSYGIQVAQLAGLPLWVTDRAKWKLDDIQSSEDELPHPGPKKINQQELFNSIDIIEKEITLVDINNMTPIDALKNIVRWQKAVKKQQRD